jgi:hypothetical protein
MALIKLLQAPSRPRGSSSTCPCSFLSQGLIQSHDHGRVHGHDRDHGHVHGHDHGYVVVYVHKHGHGHV